MKKMLGTLLIVGFLFGGNAYAGSCEVPKFLKEGKTYVITLLGAPEMHGKILEIDDDSCWIKASYTVPHRKERGTEWFNLTNIAAIREK